MTNPYHAMCAELLAWAEHTSSHYYKQPDVLTRARALLAQPEPEKPTDEELWELYQGPGTFSPVEYARAVLARWGRPTPQPVADGEVGELVETLKSIAYWRRHGKPGGLAPAPFDIRQADRLDRTADLLERFASPACLMIDPGKEALAASIAANLAGPVRLAEMEPADGAVLVPAAQPVAVSERLPGPEDCDEQGRCWAWRSFDPDVDDLGDFWLRIPCEWLGNNFRFTHWLPSNALLTPEDSNG